MHNRVWKKGGTPGRAPILVAKLVNNDVSILAQQFELHCNKCIMLVWNINNGENVGGRELRELSVPFAQFL